MARRYTETEKWSEKFLRGLQGPYKLLWIYIHDACDTAGIWEVDIEVAQIKIGMKIDEKKAIASFGDRISVIDGGLKWFINSFIELQYPTGLSENNRAHTKAILQLRKYNLLSEDLAIKPLTSPLQVAMDMEEDKEEDKEKEDEKEKKDARTKKNEPITPTVVMPFESDAFVTMWDNWRSYKLKEFKFQYKSEQSEQAALKELAALANGKESTAIAIMEQSMAKGWKGFFELKNDYNGKQTTGADQRAKLGSDLAQRMAEYTGTGNATGNGSV